MTKSEVFKMAHMIKKNQNISMSAALKISWSGYKDIDKYLRAVALSDSFITSANIWEKYGKKRLYVEGIYGKFFVDLLTGYTSKVDGYASSSNSAYYLNGTKNMACALSFEYEKYAELTA